LAPPAPRPRPSPALAVPGLGAEAALGLGQVALAGACGSHNGEPDHVASVRKVLEAAGLDETSLRCPPVLPTDRAARERAGGPAAVYHNCSGKHAYMLAGSVVRGWAPERYTEPDHPLQAVVGDTLADFTGSPIEHVGVDGCGVPVHALPLRGLATGYARRRPPGRLPPPPDRPRRRRRLRCPRPPRPPAGPGPRLRPPRRQGRRGRG